MDHALACRECRRAADAAELIPPEVLDCVDCRESLDFLWALLDDLEHFEPAVARELPRAERYLEELSDLPPDQQILKVTAETQYQEWGFCQWLLMSSRAGWHDDTRLARHYSGLAVVIAERLDPRYYHPRWLADLQGKAYSYLANTQRILGDFGQAQRNMRKAKGRVRLGVGGDAEPRVLCLEASLVGDLGGEAQALSILDRVEPHFAETGNELELVRVSMKRTYSLAHAGRPLQALREAMRTAELAESHGDLSLIDAAQRNLAMSLAQTGQVDHTRDVFDSLPPTGSGNLLARRFWVEATILRAEGKPELARRSYHRAKSVFLELGRLPDAETVDLLITQADQPPWATK